MFRRIWNLVWKEAIQFLRYRLLLVFVLVFPIWNLWSVAGSVSRGIVHIPTAVYDQDLSPASRRLVTMLRNSRHFDPDYHVGSRAELEQLLERGTVKVGLVIPCDFGAELKAEGQGATAQVLLDGTETTTALLAQAYQESGLDHSKRSPAGAVGVMQVLPSTAADPNIGIADIEKLENNIHAGTKYLRFIVDRYFKDQPMDEVNRMLFAFAAYNAGPARVNGLRKKAAKMGLDPNVWFDNVEIAAAREIGRETVQYVSNIYKYYIAYRFIEKEFRQKKEEKTRAN